MLRRLWDSPTVASWLSLGVRSCDQAAVLALVLRAFAPSEVAVWYLFLSALGMQLLIESGVSATFARMLAFAMGGQRDPAVLGAAGNLGTGEPAWEAFSATWAATGRAYSRLIGFSFLLSLSVGSLLMVRPISRLPSPSEGWVAWATVLIGAAIVTGGGRYPVFLLGVDRVALLRRLEALSGAVNLAVSTVVLLRGGGLLDLVIARQVVAVATVGALSVACRRTPEHRRRPAADSSLQGRAMGAAWPRIWRSGLGVAMSTGFFEASGFLYAQIASSLAISTYLVAVRLIQGVNQLAQAPFYSRLPTLARLRGAGLLRQQAFLARRCMRLSLWTFVGGFAAIGTAAGWLLERIGSQTSFADPTLWSLLGIAFFVERFGAMHLQLYSTTHHILWHVASGVSGAIYLLAATLLYPELGVRAFPVAMLLGHLLFYTWFSALHSYRALGLEVWRFERTTSLPPLAAMIAVVWAWGLS